METITKKPKQKILFNFRVSSSDLETMRRLAANSGVNLSKYVRRSAIGEKPQPDFEQVAFELRRLGAQIMLIRDTHAEKQSPEQQERLNHAVSYLLGRADELTRSL
jgi:hypothetical protein